MPSSTTQSGIVTQQMSSLDDTDALASAWDDALASVSERSSFRQQALMWGGRGKGGRGVARQTVQPLDIILNDISLEYVSDASSGCTGSRTLLDHADLKFLSGASGSSNSGGGSSPHGKVYALVGRNGCGKSTLLRRMYAKKIPGFKSLHLKMMYVPQEVYKYGVDGDLGHSHKYDDGEYDDDNDDETVHVTPLDVVLSQNQRNRVESKEAAEKKIRDLEEQIEGLDLENDDDGTQAEQMEVLCNEISTLEDEIQVLENGNHNYDNVDGNIKHRALQVLEYFGITEGMQQMPMAQLSGGQKKKVLLACCLFCDLDLLLLDEPTNHLDMEGIIQLRGLIKTMTDQNVTVILVSHDVNLINSVATDTVHFHNKTLTYYKGNYIDFLLQKSEHDLHLSRQQNALDKQRGSMLRSIDKMKKQSSSTASKKGSQKLSKAVSSRRKKLERHGIEKDEHGHRSTVQGQGTGIRPGSINNLDASKRKKQSYGQMLQRTELNVAPVPDKAVQFSFRDVSSVWGEPLISALNVGHGFGKTENSSSLETPSLSAATPTIFGSKKDGMLFDSVDLCIEEGSTVCILGENSCGKTTLLKVLTKEIGQSLEGKVHHAQNVNVCYLDQHKVDDLLAEGLSSSTSNHTNSISLLMGMYPKKTEEEIRKELANFGMNHQQSLTNIQFLSGGERCRLCLTMMMLQDVHVLVLDEPSNHLDPESVEALAYGLKAWNGTVVMVSHDVHLIRLLEGTCYVLMEKMGKLRRLEGGIDSYLKILGSK